MRHRPNSDTNVAKTTDVETTVSKAEIQQLKQTVDALTQQVHLLGIILDDVREDLIHAVRNNHLAPWGSLDEWRPVAPAPTNSMPLKNHNDEVVTKPQTTQPSSPAPHLLGPTIPTSQKSLFG
jgi:hypothetical protein